MDFEKIGAYASDHTTPDSKLVKQLIAASDEDLEHIDMISGRQVGQLLAMLIKVTGAKRVLEVGTFTGYSALKMAEALPTDGQLFTCEYNGRYEDIARTFIKKGEIESKISLLMGKALQTIPTIDGNFDFVFLDADKINYPRYYELIKPRLQQGGLMAIDNVLWDGEALQPESEKAEAIAKLNNKVRADKSVEQVMLTVRDGLMLLRKK